MSQIINGIVDIEILVFSDVATSQAARFSMQQWNRILNVTES